MYHLHSTTYQNFTSSDSSGQKAALKAIRRFHQALCSSIDKVPSEAALPFEGLT